VEAAVFMAHEAAHPWAPALRAVQGQLCAGPRPVIRTALGAPLLTKTELIDEYFQSQAQVTQSPLLLPSGQSAHRSPGKLGTVPLPGPAETSPGGPSSRGDGWRHRWQRPLPRDHQTLQNKLALLGPVNGNTWRKQLRRKQRKELTGLS